MVDRNNFDAESTTDEVLEGIDLSGKTAFVTGGHQGSGQKRREHWHPKVHSGARCSQGR